MNNPAIAVESPFGAAYEVKVLGGDPCGSDLALPRRRFGYSVGVRLLMRPHEGDEWIAEVAGCPPARVFTCPHPRQVAVLGDRGGALFSVDWPPEGVMLSDYDLYVGLNGFPAIEEGLLLVHDAWNRLLAFGHDGLYWDVWLDHADGFRPERVEAGVLHGQVNLPCGSGWVPCELELRTGARLT